MYGYLTLENVLCIAPNIVFAPRAGPPYRFSNTLIPCYPHIHNHLEWLQEYISYNVFHENIIC